MDRRQYTEQVLSSLRRVTHDEREAIRQELDGHMEDHMEALRELGYGEEEAEARTLAAMGDPAEVGRELNRQYPFRWLVIGRAAMIATLLFALLVAPPAWNKAGDVVNNLWCRFYPLHLLDLRELSWGADRDYRPMVTEAEKVDLRQMADGVTLYIYQAGLEDPAAEETTAWAAVSPYWDDPFRSNNVYRSLMASGDIDSLSFDFDGPFIVSGQVRRGEPLCFAYDISGETLSFEVPLPWEVDTE